MSRLFGERAARPKSAVTPDELPLSFYDAWVPGERVAADHKLMNVTKPRAMVCDDPNCTNCGSGKDPVQAIRNARPDLTTMCVAACKIATMMTGPKVHGGGRGFWVTAAVVIDTDNGPELIDVGRQLGGAGRLDVRRVVGHLRETVAHYGERVRELCFLSAFRPVLIDYATWTLSMAPLSQHDDSPFVARALAIGAPPCYDAGFVYRARGGRSMTFWTTFEVPPLAGLLSEPLFTPRGSFRHCPDCSGIDLYTTVEGVSDI